jgi:hypothetical protein
VDTVLTVRSSRRQRRRAPRTYAFPFVSGPRKAHARTLPLPSCDAQDGLSRRALGGLTGGGALSAVAGTVAASAVTTAEQPFRARTGAGSGRRPGPLVILGDDLGWADLSSYGAKPECCAEPGSRSRP